MAEKVAIYDVTTGAMLLRWSVDARACVASGSYSYEPPVLAPAEDAVAAPHLGDAVPAVVDAPAKRKRR